MRNLCWRGPPGSGKRHHVYAMLDELAKQRGFLFRIQTKQWALEKVKESDDPLPDEENGETTTTAVTPIAKDQFPYESSILHFGFDIARMSLQDRHILPPIFERLGHGSHVLMAGGGTRTDSRILVFYHLHLFSIESILSLQSVLEQDNEDIVIWCTTEHPLPLRIAHYFEERAVGGTDRSLARIQRSLGTVDGGALYDPQTVFDKAVRQMCSATVPTLGEVAGIRAFLYECLLRNIRWIDCVHHCMLAVLRLPLRETHRLAALRVLALQDGSAAGQTIPSYRIPIMWENFFLQMRNVLSGGLIGDDRTDAPALAAESSRPSNRRESAGSAVEKRGGRGRRPRVVA